ncbi:MAG: glycosyltransferase [Vulcanimicrobiota bacterium]
MSQLDIIIPVYNEGENIIPTLTSLREHVKTPCRVLICYDFPEDTTLTAIEGFEGLALVPVLNRGRGAHAAVLSGFAESSAPAVIVIPADDDFNAPILDRMVELCRDGCDLVTANRFLPGGCMQGCPWLKATLVRTAAFLLYYLARLPSSDPTSGFRLFSRRVLDTIVIESDVGFTYSLELLVKVHRLGWRIGEVPALWYERQHGQSRFRVLKWLPAYLRWFFYAFATTYLRPGPESVPRQGGHR